MTDENLRPTAEAVAEAGVRSRGVHAALLIDWENFYLGREDVCRERDGDFDYRGDLDQLLRVADGIVDAAGARTVVRRAYADFNTYDRRRSDRERWYLQKTPMPLMDRGVEPVQVFRFPGSSNKNAADIRMAVDALRLVTDANGIELFVLVSGDADFIPLAIDLRRMGTRVAAIGVEGHTNRLLRRYCDNFVLFEETLRDQEDPLDTDGALARVRSALGKVFEERTQLVSAAVRPELERRGVRIDLDAFGCERLGQFLQKYRAELGIAIREGDADPVIEAASPSDLLVPRQPNPHTTANYERLLRSNYPKIYLAAEPEWRRIVELSLAFGLAAREAGKTFLLEDLKEQVAHECAEQGMEDADRKVNAAVFQMRGAGSFAPEEAAGQQQEVERWKGPVELLPELHTYEDIKPRVRAFIVGELRERLRARAGGDEKIDAAILVELLEGPDPDPDEVARIEALAS